MLLRQGDGSPRMHLPSLKLARRALGAEEQAPLARAVTRIDTVARGDDIVREDVLQAECRIVIDGVAAHYRMLSDGGRQITQISIPGDFTDLGGLLSKRLDHGIVAITQVRVAVVPHDALAAIAREHPQLERLLWLDTLLQTASLREWLVSSGRRSALARLAHFFCEMLARYQVAGLARGDSCPLPLIQADLSDICGLTHVHTNRTLQALRNMKLIAWEKGRLTILDRRQLADLADFDPTYLHLPAETP